MSQVIIKPNTIHFSYNLLTKEELGVVNVIVPEFKIYFTANSIDEAEKEAGKMLDSFVKYWLEQNSFKSFVLQLNKLGFKAKQHNLVMHNLLKKRSKNAVLESTSKSDGYDSFDHSKIERSIAA